MNVNINKVTINLANAGKAGAAALVPVASVLLAIFEPRTRVATSAIGGHSRCSSCGRCGGEGLSPSRASRYPAAGRREQILPPSAWQHRRPRPCARLSRHLLRLAAPRHGAPAP
jgi:hypothetical protein